MADIFPVQKDLTLGRKFKTGDHSQRGRLAAAGRTEKGNELALFHGQIEVLHNDCIVEDFLDIFQLNDILTHGLTPYHVSSKSIT